jgi:polar amino acid transport system substrate-binding protein
MVMKTIKAGIGSLMILGALLSAPASAEVIQKLHDALPEQYRTNGINIAVFNDWPPDEFVEDGVLKGWSVDLAKEIESRLGVKFTYSPTSFDAIIPGLVGKRFDAGFSSFGSTPERLKALDFISQRKIGTGFGIKIDNTLEIENEADACGVSVAVMAGSWDNDLIDQLNKRACVDKGLKPVDIQQYANQAQAELAVKSGRAQATLASSAKLGYLASQSGEYRMAKLVLNPVNSCIGVRKGDPLGVVINDAIQSMIDDGSYQKIMAQWGLDDDGMLSKAVLITEEKPDF